MVVGYESAVIDRNGKEKLDLTDGYYIRRDRLLTPFVFAARRFWFQL